MSKALAPIDWVIIAGYLAIALAVGVVFARRAGRSTNEYFISGRNLPWWLAGTSMVATSFASDTPLLVTGLVRQGGIGANWIWWSFAIGGMFSVFLLSRLWRRAEVVTDVELTELRYGGRSAAALRAFRGAYMALPVNCITMAWVILGMIKILGGTLGISPIQAVAACIVLTTVYAALAGFWGVVVTDLLQFVLAMAGAVALCVLAVAGAGGLAELKAQAAAESPLGERVLAFFPSLSEGPGPLEKGFWSGPLFAFSIFLFVQWWANKNADGGGVVVQRMLASKDERNSLLATLWFNVANYALRPWPWILVALASVAVLKDLPPGEREAAYPLMMARLLPPGLMGVMVASLIGAFMSTIDTHLNLSSAYLVNDVYRRFLRRRASERHYVLVSRLASLGVMLASAALALVMTSIEELFYFLLAFTSGIGLVYILRWFWWRVSAWSEIAAMGASGAIAVVLYVLKASVLKDQLAGLTKEGILGITVAGSTAIWLVVTWLTPAVPEERLVAFYRAVRPYGRWGRIADQAGVPPARGLGRLLLVWIAGSVMVLAATLAVGKLLLLEWAAGAGYALAAAAGAAVVAWEVRGNRAEPAHLSS